MGKKKGASASDEPTPESTLDKYANELQRLIDRIDPDEFADDLGTNIWNWFTELETFSSAAVKAGERDANIFDLQTALAGSDEALLRAKVWTLEKENASLRAKIELNEDVASSLKELLPKIDIKTNNTVVIREELPTIIKQIACEDLSNSVKTANSELVEQVKQNCNETRSFAQVALQAKNLPPGDSSFRPPSSKPEGVLLIKPKDDTVRNHESNRKIFVEMLQKNDPGVRLRGIGKIYGGGIKLIAASLDEIQAIKGVLMEKGDSEVLNKYDLVVPN
ncbi:hypothetical protein AVEN_208858-1 [Araneus ventricosus]|uniref:Uncharacterized protein n=1 Tax=Araneus ventricosus TaxID=182803 RepID=A0A4Y2KME5_ARAVE|nr:hypothetical protein AVEN_208858-1 [Araneus ventricosus]